LFEHDISPFEHDYVKVKVLPASLESSRWRRAGGDLPESLPEAFRLGSNDANRVANEQILDERQGIGQIHTDVAQGF
jgi:hypothetical protein